MEKKFILEDIKPAKKWLVISLAFAILSAIVDVFTNRIMQQLIDSFAMKELRRGGTFIARVVAILVIGGILKYGIVKSNALFSNNVMEKLRGRLAKQIIDARYQQICNEGKGNILSLFNNELMQINNFCENLSTYIYVPVLLCISTVYLLTVNWMLFLLSFGFIPFVLVVVHFLSKPVDKMMSKYYQELGKSNDVAADNIKGICEIRAFGLYRKRKKIYKDLLIECLKEQKYMEKRFTYIMFLMILVNELPILVCLIGSIYIGIPAGMSIGEIIAFMQLLRFIIQPVTQVSSIIQQWKLLKGAMLRLHNILDLEKESVEKEEMVEKIETIDVNDLSFTYSDEESVLDGISLNLSVGHVYAFVGSSGSGKSTLLKILAGLFDEVGFNVNGSEIRKYNIESYRGKVTYVAQDSYLYNTSIWDNLTFVNENITRDKLEEILKKVNAYDFIAAKEEGFDTMLTEGGSNISGGERQRLAIARALTKDVQVVVLDEPTSELDVESEKKVMQSLQTLFKNKIVLISAHRLSTIENASKIFVMEKGKIVENGNHDELMALKGFYYNLHETGKEYI